jgi:DNA helicase-2/ATP-dependent DNA helicase PcrA
LKLKTEKKEFQKKTTQSSPVTTSRPTSSTPININTRKNSDSDFSAASPDEIEEGMRVLHQKFGQGTVAKVEGIGPNKKATVIFDECGSKQLMLKFAKLNILK